jgi:hypothetical protein
MPPGSNILLDYFLHASVYLPYSGCSHAVQGLLDHQAPPAKHPSPSTRACRVKEVLLLTCDKCACCLYL